MGAATTEEMAEVCYDRGFEIADSPGSRKSLDIGVANYPMSKLLMPVLTVI